MVIQSLQSVPQVVKSCWGIFVSVNQHDSRIVVRFGDAILQAGFTSVPNLVLEHYAEVGISEGELVFTLHVWSFWWNRQLPYPSIATVAKRMNKSWRSVHRYAKGLEEKQLLKITPRYREDGGQTSSLYDFEPMINAIVALITPSDTSDRGESDRFDTPPLTEMADKEDPRDPDKDLEEFRISNFINDFAHEMRDRAPRRSSTSRAINLFKQSGLALEDFTAIMYEARARTKRSTNVNNKMSYWFACLESLVKGEDN